MNHWSSTRPIASHREITSPRVTKKAKAVLDTVAVGEQPWFLWVHYFDPHAEYRFHEGVSEAFVGEGQKQIGLYDGEIAFTDRYVGQLLQHLQHLGLADDTVVAFATDHGEEFGEHGFKGHGKTLYREVERVPFAIRIPGTKPRRVSDPVSLVDFMPTILEVLDIPRPAIPMMGQSLVAAMNGASLPERGLLLELRAGLRKVYTDAYIYDRWKLILELPPPYDGKTTAMLFDWRADPGETRNLAQANLKLTADLARRCQEAVRLNMELGKAFTASPELSLSAEELERLRQLGYIGDSNK